MNVGLHLGRLILIATALGGCAGRTTRPAPPELATRGTAAPIPYVQNCGVLNTGTPSKFVCNGKVFTSFQLAKIREVEAKKYAAGQ